MSTFFKNILAPVCNSIHNFPNQNAFFIDGTYYTYAHFAERISAIRGVIRSAEKDEQIWGLRFADNLNTYAAILALWMEGKAYVPLHPNWPEERVNDIIGQIGCSNIIDANDLSLLSIINHQPSTDCFLEPFTETSDNNIVYVLFTSGSTGKPKGVPLTRKNLASFVQAFWNIGYELTEEDRCLQCFDLTFDLSVMSYLVPLLRGACVYTVPFDVVKYMTIVQLMMEHQLTFALMTPSTIQYLQPYFDELQFPAMRYSLFCGEALPAKTTDGWAKCLPNAVIDNVYGPTEDTIFCTCYRYVRGGSNKEHNGVLSIGKSMTSGQVAVFDGELCLAGNQLTPGYWQNPEKNAEAFFEQDGIRWYRTGDLCTIDDDGDLMFVGRKDSQVKINGFRIELGEIEYHVCEFYNKEKRVMAIAFQNDKNLTEIAMFIECQEEDTKDLISYMRSKMPAYMIPTRFIFLENFPLNKSEKVDRNALKQML